MYQWYYLFITFYEFCGNFENEMSSLPWLQKINNDSSFLFFLKQVQFKLLRHLIVRLQSSDYTWSHWWPQKAANCSKWPQVHIKMKYFDCFFWAWLSPFVHYRLLRLTTIKQGKIIRRLLAANCGWYISEIAATNLFSERNGEM